MTEPASPIAGLRQRYDDLPPEWRQRIPALALALAVEILLVLVLLSLGSVKREVVAMTDTLVAFTTSSQDEEEAVADAPTPAEMPDTSSPGDTLRIAGSGPNGEPLYAARWYRRPYDDELAGYLSTAQGPGWGLIDCRTVPDFRVEDCVVVGESPQGSGIAQAVLAASWQFKVRPPQRGGRPMVGEWVRIRISYEIDPGEAARRRLRN